MQSLKRYSWSVFDAYMKCAMKVYFAKIWGVEEIESEYFAFGKNVHKEVENYHIGLPYNEKLISRYTEVIPSDYYVQVEQWIEAYIHNPDDKNDKIETMFVGRLDGIGNDFIADLKTMGRSISQNIADNMGQITLYLYMDWIKTGKIRKFRILNLRKDRNSKGELFPLQIIETSRTIEDFKKMWKDLKAFDNSVQDEVFYKEPSYECQQCSFRRVCAGE